MNLTLHIKNPWYKENFKNLFNWNKQVSKNKVVEIEFIRYSYDLMSLEVNLAWKGSDHAGPYIEIGLLGYTGSIKLYDIRHWDYDKKDWSKYDV